MQNNLEEKQQKISNKKLKQIQLSIVDTKYDVVKDVGLSLNFKIIQDPNDNQWDLYWTDSAVQAEQLAKMRSHQKINHWPGMFTLSRKNNLGIQLMKMKKQFQSYNFFPQTWIVPADNNDLKLQFNQKQNKTFIVKPEASCQGKGIFLIRRHQDIPPKESFVVQRYIDNPYLIDGLKFDLRLYVLLAGVEPLRIYMYKDGLARFATEPYQNPTQNNLSNVCLHLTNYAINMNSPNYIFNTESTKTDIGHKRSFQSVLKHLQNEGHNTEFLLNEIKQMFIKTFASTQPVISHHYKTCQPDNYKNNMCFEILGIDVIIDNTLKPWLLEVNHTPSFTTDTPFDYDIKFNLIKDTIQLLNFNEQDKQQQIQKQKEEIEKRIQQGIKKPLLNAQDKQILIDQHQLERDMWELKNLGNYESITQALQPEEIKMYINYSNQLYIESTGANIKRNTQKEQSVVSLQQVIENQEKNNSLEKYELNQKFIEFQPNYFNQEKQQSYHKENYYMNIQRLHSPNNQQIIRNKYKQVKIPLEFTEFKQPIENFLSIQSLQLKSGLKQDVFFLPSIQLKQKKQIDSKHFNSINIKKPVMGNYLNNQNKSFKNFLNNE